MVLLGNDWTLLEWFYWLEETMNLKLGQDYRWAWYQDFWAIEVFDADTELMILLSKPDGKPNIRNVD